MLGLRALEAEETDVSSFVLSLPEPVRQALRQYAGQIHSEKDLHEVAGQLMEAHRFHERGWGKNPQMGIQLFSRRDLNHPTFFG